MGSSQSRFRNFPSHIDSIVRACRNSGSWKSQNLSNKLLLKDDDSSDPQSVQDQDHNKRSLSLSSSSSKGKRKLDRVKVVPILEPDEPKENVDKAAYSDGCKTDKEEKREKKVIEIAPPAALKDEVLVDKCSRKKNELEEDDNKGCEEEGRLNDFDDRLISPGSPSFRIYLVESVPVHEDDDEDNDTDETSLAEDKSTDSPNSSEVSEASVTKKTEKKGSKFRKVMGRGRPRAVRNLLSLTSCYNPAWKTHHQHPQPVPR